MNGERLSEEGILSPLRALKTGDSLDFGVDIKDDEGKKLYSKVSTLVTIDYESVPQNSDTLSRTRDAEELLALINDEKTMSMEASEALDRIKQSFDFLEANSDQTNTAHIEKPADFDLKLSEMNEKIVNLEKTVNFSLSDLKSMKSNTIVKKDDNQNNVQMNDNVSILETSVSETILKVSNLEKNSERQLVVTILTEIRRAHFGQYYYG